MNSIRGRLLLLLLTGLTVVVLVGGCGVYWIERASLQRQFDASLLARAHTVAALANSEPVMIDGQLRIRNVFDGDDGPLHLLEQTFFEYYFEGQHFSHRGVPFEPVLGFRAPADGDHEFGDVTLETGTVVRCVWLQFIPAADEEDWVGIDMSEVQFRPLVVAAALDREPVDQALATLATTLWVVGAALCLSIALLVLVGVRWGLRPLDRLRRQLGAVSGRETDERIDDAGSPRELRPVYAELNRMLGRVEQTLDRERSFAGAAAHELRTPLSELRSTAEIAMRWPDQERAQEALRETLEIGREMEHLVESLLLISRGQASKIEDEHRAVPVQPIIRECLFRADSTIRSRNLSVTVDVPQDDVMPGSPEALEIILRNLIDNAVRYTPEGGSVIVRDGSPNNGVASLEVANGPVALEDGDLDRLFQPFWQAHEGRSDRSHVGLGLAVVKQAADVCKLSVNASLADHQLCIRVSGRVNGHAGAADCQ